MNLLYRKYMQVSTVDSRDWYPWPESRAENGNESCGNNRARTRMNEASWNGTPVGQRTVSVKTRLMPLMVLELGDWEPSYLPSWQV